MDEDGCLSCHLGVRLTSWQEGEERCRQGWDIPTEPLGTDTCLGCTGRERLFLLGEKGKKQQKAPRRLNSLPRALGTEKGRSSVEGRDGELHP